MSPSPSSDDELRPGLDRQPLDRNGARRRFETSRINAKDVDFSDSIGGTRRAYRTHSSRRRRRRIQENGGEEVGDLSESEDETLGTKLARLKREAEEVRMELERRDREKDEEGDFEDSVEQQHQRKEDDADVDADGVQELNRALHALSTRARLKTAGSTEAEFVSQLRSSRSNQHPRSRHEGNNTQPFLDDATPTSLSAAAEFSDRLTALESALGVSSESATSQESAILPTLANLSTQITTLSATLVPHQSASTSASASTSTPTTSHLDTISSKLKALSAESDRLTQSRKAAIVSLTDLHDKRMQQLVSGATVHASTRPTRLRNLSAEDTSTAANGATDQKDHAHMGGPGEESLQIHSQLFLDEQASKITALHHLLPTIRDLQPLLPVVLERLRTLSVLHNGAAQAKRLIDELENRQRETKQEVDRWREAVERVESGMKEAEEVMKSNVDALGGRLREVEERVGKLDGAR